MQLSPPPGFARHLGRSLPRYTSYPTALAFEQSDESRARRWAGSLQGEPLSVYVHVPFCQSLCWYCGCHTSVPNGYSRIAAYVDDLEREVELWADALGGHGGAAFVHFGGGSPNALDPGDFVRLAARLRAAFGFRGGAEIAVELDPRRLDEPFLAGLAEAGVTRASLGVQTFDPLVQARINRVQPLDQVARAVALLRGHGVKGVNFDLMYGLPGQDPASVGESARFAAALRPDRVSVFGYAHVPWFKKHQKMIRQEDLAGPAGRWAQAEAADAALVMEGYRRVGIDHYALAGDTLIKAARAGALRRNFQGYTTDSAPILVPLGASAIGRFPGGYIQNARAVNTWAKAVRAGALAIERGLTLTTEDRLRARVIERLMCDLKADVGGICEAEGFAADRLDEAVAIAALLQADALCRVEHRRIVIPEGARRLARVVAAAFDTAIPAGEQRHAKAV